MHHDLLAGYVGGESRGGEGKPGWGYFWINDLFLVHFAWRIIIHTAYTGRFCDEDLDGCTELTCFDGVACVDVPAPGIRAVCGSCPPGYSGDGLNCIGMFTAFNHRHSQTSSNLLSSNDSYAYTTCTDMDECAMNTHNCEQMCINTPGGFSCACSLGFTLINETHCIGTEGNV